MEQLEGSGGYSPGPDEIDVKSLSEVELRGLIDTQEIMLEKLEESLLSQQALFIDNMGWEPLGADRSDNGTGISLDALKRAAELGEALATANPQVKRGIAVRTSYIWGSGVKLEGVQRTGNRSLWRAVGSTEAQFELERTLATNGNVFFQVSTRRDGSKFCRRVPLSYVVGVATDPDDMGVITYIRLRYMKWDRPTDGVLNVPNNVVRSSRQTEVDVWVPTMELEGRPASSIDGVAVDRDSVIKHAAVNRMAGWWWGVPDLYSVTYWVRAYKKYLEQCALLNEAYAQFAWKATSASRRGNQRMAARMSQAPAHDPKTGQPLSNGATAVLGANQDLAPLQHSRSVDFNNGRPLAAMVAAGLDIPLHVLTSDAGDSASRASDNSLDEATKKTMESRQQFLNDTMEDLAELMGTSSYEIDWPDVAAEPLHRTIQALDQAGRTGMLYPDEWRSLITRALGVDNTSKVEPPEAEELPITITAANNGESEVEANTTAQVEPPSYGDHELRDEGLQTHTEET